MKTLDHFTKLYEQLSPIKIGKEIPITRKGVSELLYCSERNAIFILKKLQDEHWIKWTNGRGRGNTSFLTFLKDPLDLLLEKAMTSMKEGDIEQVLSITHLLKEEHKREFYGMLPQVFGFTESIEKDTKLDVFTFPYFRQLYSLTPAYIERQSERHMVAQVFDTLVTYDSNHKDYVPQLAHYWSYNKEQFTWTFYLRKGVTFHNGKELTSEDVYFTFNTLIHTPMKWAVEKLLTIIPIDRYTVQFQFDQEFSHFISLLSSAKLSIIPNHYAGYTETEFSYSPVGTGPFRIKERSDQQLLLEAHPTYFVGRAHLDRIVMVYAPEIETFMTDRGHISYFPFLKKEQSLPPFHKVSRSHLSIKYMMWNEVKEVSPALRGCFNSLIEKNRLVETLGGNRYAPTDFLSKVSHREFKENNCENTSMTLKIMTYHLVPNLEDLEWMKKTLAPFGINLVIQALSYPDFLNQEIHKEADLFYSEYVIEEDPHSSLFNALQSETSMIFNGLSSKSKQFINELIWEKERLIKIEEFLLNEQLLLPLYSTFQEAYFHPSVKGTNLTSVGLASFKDLFFMK